MRYNDRFGFKNIGISGDEWRAECQEKVVGKDNISDNDAAGRRCAGIGQAV